MEWFYAENGQQCGPVSEAQLDEMVGSGKLPASSLVWCQGMAQWQPYDAVRAKPPLMPAGGEMARCAECGQIFPTDDLLRYQESWVCAKCKPIFFQRLREGAPPSASMMLWRSGRLLVMNQGASLPDRCVKCNAPANGQRLTRKLYWHSSYIYLLVLVNLLVYALVAILVRKKARVEIGLCDSHRSQRRLAIAVGWVMALIGIALIVVSIAKTWGWAALAGVILLFTALVIGAVKGTVISPKRIDAQFVWIKGVCPAYLHGLPEWREGQ